MPTPRKLKPASSIIASGIACTNPTMTGEIEFGISNINEEDYKESLIKCITIYKKKSKTFQEFKLVNYLLNKGYDRTFINDNIKNY